MRLVLATALALGLTAAPARAADVDIGGFAFSPATVTIAQGDSVTWHYAGPDTNHSVTADPGQADSWDSDPGRSPTAADHPPGTTYARRFDKPGSFTYLCKVHSSMHGRVVVNATGGGGGPQPPPAADTTPPALSEVSARAVRRPKPIAVRFELSEDATVRVAVKGRPKAGVERAARAGAGSVKLSTRKLKPGRYRLTVTATDAAGNVSAPVKRTVRVRKRL
jgi:plastocyanin